MSVCVDSLFVAGQAAAGNKFWCLSKTRPDTFTHIKKIYNTKVFPFTFAKENKFCLN